MSDLSTKIIQQLPVIPASKGGTGIANNDACTTTRVGNFAKTETLTGITSLSFPTTGTLATLAGSETLTNKTLTGNIAVNLVSGAATVTLPTTTGTLATLAGSETLTNKTLTAPVINSPVMAGLIPLGGVVATFPNLAGAYVCATTTAADANGFVKCNGDTIVDATSPMNGVVVPYINNSRFLVGSTTAGSSGGADTISASNLPVHTHTFSGTANSSSVSGLAHTHPFSGTASASSISGTANSGVNLSHTHVQNFQPTGSGGAVGGGSSVYAGAGDQNSNVTTQTSSGTLDHSHSVSGTASGQAFSGTTASTTPTGTAAGQTFSGTTGNGPGTGLPYLPPYISAVYCMRIK